MYDDAYQALTEINPVTGDGALDFISSSRVKDVNNIIATANSNADLYEFNLTVAGQSEPINQQAIIDVLQMERANRVAELQAKLCKPYQKYVDVANYSGSLATSYLFTLGMLKASELDQAINSPIHFVATAVLGTYTAKAIENRQFIKTIKGSLARYRAVSINIKSNCELQND